MKQTGPLSFAKKSGTALETGIPEVFVKGNSAQFPPCSKEANPKQNSIEAEKSLRHVAMVATFLDDNKPKCHLKSGFALFQISSILISFNLSNAGEIFWVESVRTVSKFRKRKKIFCVLCSPTS